MQALPFGTLIAHPHKTTRSRITTARIEVRVMSTATRNREVLDRRTALEIERFLQARQAALSSLIRRGLGERQEPPAEEGDEEATASRTLESEVQAALVDRASRELGQVDAALELLRQRRYGHCRDCAEFIGLARLRSLPFAQRCRPCQERAERAQTLESRRSLAALATAE
jgi:RNA polymerase-binding transcription factor DksA